jgi:hypothetical protein
MSEAQVGASTPHRIIAGADALIGSLADGAWIANPLASPIVFG